MIRIPLEISGMMCSMCEAHINDAVRSAFPVKKVQSSHKRGETLILTETPLDMEKLRDVIGATGYTLTNAKEETVESHSFLDRFKKH